MSIGKLINGGKYIYFYEKDTQSYNLCEWVGENKYCSIITGKIYFKTYTVTMKYL